MIGRGKSIEFFPLSLIGGNDKHDQNAREDTAYYWCN